METGSTPPNSSMVSTSTYEACPLSETADLREAEQSERWMNKLLQAYHLTLKSIIRLS